jgi:DNA-binding PadR family transcriptional regulator
LERDELIRSHWERQSIADAALRPPRKYYKLSRSGETALETSRKRYPLIAKLVPANEVQDCMKAEWLQYTTLRLASLMAPSDRRAEWLREWRSESLR